MMIYVGPQSWIQGAFMVPQLKDLTVIIKQSSPWYILKKSSQNVTDT